MEGEQPSLNISDVIEVIETDEMYAGGPGNGAVADNRRPKAQVRIIEQPASKALRFRYECEGRSAGSIPGVNSTHENKTYPAIQIVGYHGKAVVIVSCVTKDAPYRPHPHNLVGKEGCSRGVCSLKMHTDTITFSNLGIQCVKKKDIEEALKVRQDLRVDPFKTGYSHKTQPSSIDLNSVRLCFQVFLEGPKKDEFKIPLKPVVSDPIYDKNPAVLKRKRQKYDGESSPQNVLRLPQDDDSRSTYVGSLSPNAGYQMLQVKREPSEQSPINYNYGGSISPMYQGTSPGPSSPHNTPSPVPCQPAYANFNLLRHSSGGGLLEVKPCGVNPYKPEVPYAAGTSKQLTMDYRNMYPINYAEPDLSDASSYTQQDLAGKIGSTNMGTVCPVGIVSKHENDTNRSQFPVGASGNTVVDMDSHHYSLDLNLQHLDSAELERMALMTDVNLSENLSSNLTLDEKGGKSAMDCDQSNVNEVIQELVSMGDANRPSQP